MGGCRSCPRWRRSPPSCASAPSAVSSRGSTSASISVLKTYDPPLHRAGRPDGHRRRPARQVPRPRRRRPAPGRPPGPGRLAALARRAARRRRRGPGKGPLALRVHLDRRQPASTSPRRAPRSGSPSTSSATPHEVPGIARLGPDPLAAGFDRRRRSPRCSPAGARRSRALLRDQSRARRHRQRLLRRDPARGQAVAVHAGGSACDRGRGRPAVRRDARRSLQRRGRRARAGKPATELKDEKKSRHAGARPHRAAVPGVRRHRARGVASPTPRCSTARPARPAASRWPTAGCPGC